MDNRNDYNQPEADDFDFSIGRYFDEDEEMEDGDPCGAPFESEPIEAPYENAPKEAAYKNAGDAIFTGDEAYGASAVTGFEAEASEAIDQGRETNSAENTAGGNSGEAGAPDKKRGKKAAAEKKRAKRKAAADKEPGQAKDVESAKPARERRWPGMRSNLRVMLVLFTTMFAVLLVYFIYSVTTFGGRWFNNPYNPRIQSEKDRVIPGNILDRNQIVLAATDADGERVYNDDRSVRTSVSHVVGDNYGLTTTGAESFFARTLLGFNAGLFERVYTAVASDEARGESVVLTIDAELTAYASDAFRDYRGRRRRPAFNEPVRRARGASPVA